MFGHVPVMVEFFLYSDAPSKAKVSQRPCHRCRALIVLNPGIDVSYFKLARIAQASVLTRFCILLVRCRALQSYHQYFSIAVQVVVTGEFTDR